MKPNGSISSIKKSTKRISEKVNINIYILPNLLTTANMFCGFFAIIYTIKGEFLLAAYAIVAAAVFDLLDGRVARITNSTSAFGAEYDSLSDICLLYTSPSPRDKRQSRMPSSA